MEGKRLRKRRKRTLDCLDNVAKRVGSHWHSSRSTCQMRPPSREQSDARRSYTLHTRSPGIFLILSHLSSAATQPRESLPRFAAICNAIRRASQMAAGFDCGSALSDTPAWVSPPGHFTPLRTASGTRSPIHIRSDTANIWTSTPLSGEDRGKQLIRSSVCHHLACTWQRTRPNGSVVFLFKICLDSQNSLSSSSLCSAPALVGQTSFFARE